MQNFQVGVLSGFALVEQNNLVVGFITPNAVSLDAYPLNDVSFSRELERIGLRVMERNEEALRELAYR